MDTLFNEELHLLNILRQDKIMFLRSAGGGEHLSESVKASLEARCISDEGTTASSTDSNGKAERLKRIFIDMGSFTLNNMAAENSEKFWEERISAAIRNILYKKACSTSRTPSEELHGMRPDLSHIRVFESKSFLHKAKKRRTRKFGGKGEE